MRRLMWWPCACLFSEGLVLRQRWPIQTPDTNKNAVIVTFACGEDTVDVVTIRHNAAPSCTACGRKWRLGSSQDHACRPEHWRGAPCVRGSRLRSQQPGNDDLHCYKPALPECCPDHGGVLQARLESPAQRGAGSLGSEFFEAQSTDRAGKVQRGRPRRKASAPLCSTKAWGSRGEAIGSLRQPPNRLRSGGQGELRPRLT